MCNRKAKICNKKINRQYNIDLIYIVYLKNILMENNYWIIYLIWTIIFKYKLNAIKKVINSI